ncbi:hypothetical protein DFH08DRAFT_321822 [Mycena albidolilacea]|uniref:Secreted protein n=1 Tax=Mycena albidolilacea TaxID=1033008 RepID=A0AAD7ALH7_9AGAR|nr:hypothetical protein DFH08DRAFT_321822 [Mycena albidolilacea]
MHRLSLVIFGCFRLTSAVFDHVLWSKSVSTGTTWLQTLSLAGIQKKLRESESCWQANTQMNILKTSWAYCFSFAGRTRAGIHRHMF